MGAVGVKRLEASANHSFEHDRTFPPRGAEMRSVERSVYCGEIDLDGGS